MFTVGSSTSATFVLPVRHGTCVAVQTKRMETDMLWSNYQAEAGAKISKWLGNPHSISFLYPASRHMTKLYASWKALQNIHFGQPRGSHFQVRFVWQVWDGQLSPSFKYIRFYQAFGGWKCDRGTTKAFCTMLGFYGERVCRRRNQLHARFTVGTKLWEPAQLLSYQCVTAHV